MKSKLNIVQVALKTLKDSPLRRRHDNSNLILLVCENENVRRITKDYLNEYLSKNKKIKFTHTMHDIIIPNLGVIRLLVWHPNEDVTIGYRHNIPNLFVSFNAVDELYGINPKERLRDKLMRLFGWELEPKAEYLVHAKDNPEDAMLWDKKYYIYEGALCTCGHEFEQGDYSHKGRETDYVNYVCENCGRSFQVRLHEPFYGFKPINQITLGGVTYEDRNINENTKG